MASSTALFDTPDQVRKNFVRCGAPYYIIADTRGDKLWWNDEIEDLDQAAQLLFEDLNNIRQGNTATYVIKHYLKVPTGGLKKNSEPYCVSTYRKAYVNDQERTNYPGAAMMQNNMIMEELRALRSEIAQMKLEQSIQDSEQDEEIIQQAQPASILGTILGNPDVQTMLANLLTNITANLITPHHMNKPTALAGTEDKQITLESILETLFAKGVTIQDLHKISEMPKDKIHSMLNMLRIM